jgi:O-antigen ligase
MSMTWQRAFQVHKQISWLSAPWRYGFVMPKVHNPILQWVIAILVGIGLGGYALVTGSVRPPLIPLLALMGLFPFILMIVGNVRRLMLAIVILDIPLQLDVYLDYRPQIADLGAFGGFNISVTTAALIVLYTLWLIRLLVRTESPARSLLRSSFPLSLYLGFVILSLVAARDITLSFFQISFLCQMFLLYLYIANSVQTRQDVIFIIKVFLICLAFESLIMIGVYLTGHNISVAGISTKVEAGFDRRSGGTFGSPNNAAAYLSLLLVPALSLLLTDSERWIKRLALFAFGLGVIALVLTFSRGGWAALLLSGVILCLAAWRRGWLSPLMRMAVIMVASLLGVIFYIFIFSSVSRDDGGRLILMDLAFRMIKDHPWFGVGANNFVLLIQQYATPDIENAWLYTVHNMYLLVWTETGIGGLLTFILFLVVTLRRGWQCWKLQDRFLAPLALSFTAAIIGHMAHMFLDYFNDRPDTQLLWLISGLIFAMNNMEAREMNMPYQKIAHFN